MDGIGIGIGYLPGATLRAPYGANYGANKGILFEWGGLSVASDMFI